MDNQELYKKRIEENMALLNMRLEDAMNRTAILRTLDLVALEAMRLGIPDWESMKIGALRAEIKQRQDAERQKGLGRGQTGQDAAAQASAEDREDGGPQGPGIDGEHP